MPGDGIITCRLTVKISKVLTSTIYLLCTCRLHCFNWYTCHHWLLWPDNAWSEKITEKCMLYCIHKTVYIMLLHSNWQKHMNLFPDFLCEYIAHLILFSYSYRNHPIGSRRSWPVHWRQSQRSRSLRAQGGHVGCNQNQRPALNEICRTYQRWQSTGCLSKRQSQEYTPQL